MQSLVVMVCYEISFCSFVFLFELTALQVERNGDSNADGQISLSCYKQAIEMLM